MAMHVFVRISNVSEVDFCTEMIFPQNWPFRPPIVLLSRFNYAELRKRLWLPLRSHKKKYRFNIRSSAGT